MCPKCMKKHGGSKSAANAEGEVPDGSAERLGISRASVMSKVKDLRERDRRKIMRLFDAGEIDLHGIMDAIEGMQRDIDDDDDFMMM